MTSSASISDSSSSLVLSNPDTLLAAIPFLVGFTPTESVVIVWLERRQILLTQRADLPPESDVEAWVDVVFGHVGARTSDEIVIAAYSWSPTVAQIVDRVRERAASHGISIRDALQTDGERWRSLLCTDPLCCDLEGKPIDSDARAVIGAEFTVRGVAPSPTREDLVRELAVDREGRAAATALLDARGAQLVALFSDDPDGARREAWRDDCIVAALSALSAHTSEPHDAIDRIDCAADLMQGLIDVRVRDTVLWECTGLSPEQLHMAHSAFSAAVTVAPPGHVAPVATCAAIMAWLLGDGARASIALERALTDNPEYSLARLVCASVQGGLPPWTWRDAMRAVGRSNCRHGSKPSKQRRRARKARVR